MSDARLSFAEMPSWRQSHKQALHGSDYVTVEPNSKLEETPTQIDFDLSSSKSLLFGPMSKFYIRGSFECQKANETTWTTCAAAEVGNVLLAFNWFELLIKSVDVFHSNSRISSSNEARFISPFLNAMIYQNMDPVAKKLLCPQPEHFARCGPSKRDGWTLDSDEWKTYGKLVFNGDTFDFDYVPLFQWPFYQGSNHLIEGSVPRIVPMPLLGKLQIRITFFDKQSHIFRKKTGNTSKYRFAFQSFQLMVEEARLSPAYERSLYSSKKILAYPGLTRIQLVEPVPNGTSVFKTRFQEIWMPESILIICLNKNVASGTYSFADDTGKNVFLDHNINSVDLAFDGMKYSLKGSHLGNIREDILATKSLMDHLAVPIFGVSVDPSKVVLDELANGGTNSAYPHVYIPLVNYGAEANRIIPSLDDGSCLTKRCDLEIGLNFVMAGSRADSIYVIYAAYTDVNTLLDLKNKHFSSPYLQYMN